MSAPRKADGVAPRHREDLPRKRRRVPFELRITTYEKLLSLAKDESMVSVVERLILSATVPSRQPAN